MKCLSRPRMSSQCLMVLSLGLNTGKSRTLNSGEVRLASWIVTDYPMPPRFIIACQNVMCVSSLENNAIEYMLTSF